MERAQDGEEERADGMTPITYKGRVGVLQFKLRTGPKKNLIFVSGRLPRTTCNLI